MSHGYENIGNIGRRKIWIVGKKRRFLPIAAKVFASIGLVSATISCAAFAPSGADRAAAPGQSTRFAPYVDVTLERPALAEVAEATGQRTFALGFALADGDRCTPTWGGLHSLTDKRILEGVSALRAAGGDVVVSSGGADGPYLEDVCPDAETLAAAYAKALDAVGSNALDIDIEGSVPVGTVARAAGALQRERGTAVTYTLRVLDSRRGLEPVALRALREAAARGVDVTVNPMVMNFPYTGDWGTAMVAALRTTHRQMQAIWPRRGDARLYRMLGATAMIGRNDSGMVTTEKDARTLLGFARSHGLGYVGFWSLARDNGGCPGAAKASNTCSGLAQSPYAFTKLFRSRTG